MSLPSNQGQVLGVNLNCSESAWARSQPEQRRAPQIRQELAALRDFSPLCVRFRSSRPIDPPAAVAACLLGRVAALLRRSGKEPRMAIEVAGGIGAAVGFVVRGLDDFRAGRFRSGMVRIDVI
jgi:hypothetical protein